MTIITIIIVPDGQSVVETNGFSGASCRDASRFLEQALGKRQTETLKAEFYTTVNNELEQTEGT